MRKWMNEFLSKSESRDNKIARVYLIRNTKSINLLLFHTGIGVRCDGDVFKPTPRAQYIIDCLQCATPTGFVASERQIIRATR